MKISSKLFILLAVTMLASCGAPHGDDPVDPVGPVDPPEEKFLTSTADLRFPDYSSRTVSKVMAELKYGYKNTMPQVVYMEPKVALDYISPSATTVTKIDDNKIQYTTSEGAVLTIDSELDKILVKNYTRLNLFSSEYVTEFNLVDEMNTARWVQGSTEMQNVKDATFDLGKYGMDVIIEDGVGYIPFSVLNRLSFNQKYYSPVAWNGEAFYLLDQANGFTSYYSMYNGQYMEEYYGCKKLKELGRTKKFAEYNRDAFLFDLEYFYGFKDERFLPNMKEYLKTNNSNLYNDLASTEETVYSHAVAQLVNFVIGDGHSNAGNVTSAFGEGSGVPYPDNSARQQQLTSNYYKYANLRNDANIECNVPCVSGSTLYIAFDGFNHKPVNLLNESAYKTVYENNKDSFAMIKHILDTYASNESIKNVVLDISVNGGGDTNALIPLMGLMKREFNAVCYDVTSGINSYLTYRVDTNLDGVYDEKDSYEGRFDFFVMTSEYSFSCASLFPFLAKENNCAKIIGKRCGGGACVVDYTCTPDGLPFRISGAMRNGKLQNPVMHDDDGVEPDYVIESENFYNIEYINNLIESKARN